MVTFLLPRSFLTLWHPRAVIDWSGKMYHQVFGDPFVLKEYDYTVNGLRKFGGNAQAITQNLVSHHTSFLWKPDVAALERYLKIPAKQPQYRRFRSHQDFVCGIEEAFAHKFKSAEQVLNQVTHVLRRECQEKSFFCTLGLLN